MANEYVPQKKIQPTRTYGWDVALIKDDQPAPCTQWRIGRVLEHVKGLDGQIRGAKLKALLKKGKQSVVH